MAKKLQLLVIIWIHKIRFSYYKTFKNSDAFTNTNFNLFRDNSSHVFGLLPDTESNFSLFISIKILKGQKRYNYYTNRIK